MTGHNAANPGPAEDREDNIRLTILISLAWGFVVLAMVLSVKYWPV